MDKLVKLEDHRGNAIFLAPMTVDAIAVSVVDGCSAVWLSGAKNMPLTVRGIPTEVHAKLFPEAK